MSPCRPSTGLPVIYVSHDMAEVERLADHLLLMDGAGRGIVSGPLTVLQSDPALPLMKARDAAVSLDAVVEHHDAA
jgi:molybdate transport system ATP-binding protein